VNYTGWL